MNQKNRRRHFLIDKPLQFRYMAWILLILSTITVCIFVSLYFGIWGEAIKEFSDESIRNTLQVTSRLHDYEVARFQAKTPDAPRLDFIKETELFSQRQREIIQEILARSQKRVFILCLPLLFFIGWGTIFLSHKIAGPLYHFNKVFKELKEKNLRSRVHLRKLDEAKKLAETFNQTIEELDCSLSKIKKIIKANENPTELRNELSKELAKFKTTED